MTAGRRPGLCSAVFFLLDNMKLIRLSQNTFVRQYGPYTHLFNQLTKSDIDLKDAEPFLRFIGRKPISVNNAVARIIGLFDEVEPAQVQKDFLELLGVLVEGHYVVEGASPEELGRKDPSFTYDVEVPSTAFDLGNISEHERQEAREHAELHEYFEAHPTPFSLHLDLTSRCTEKCVHCYVPRNRHFTMETDAALKAIDEFREMGGLCITLSGGECMLHPEFKKILAYAREKDLSVSVLSNLTLCDEAMGRFLATQNLSLVQVSLYSMTPETHDAITQLPGSFAKTKAAIERLHSLNVPVQISCPTMKGNYKGYQAVLNYGVSLKCKAYTDFIMMARSDHTTDNLANRLSLEETREIITTIAEHDPSFAAEIPTYDPSKEMSAEEWGNLPMCGVGIDAICLNADGNYYPCSGFQNYPLGNCHEQTLKDVWEKSPAILYLRGLRKKDIPQCLSCKDRMFCATCLVRNFNETGDMLKVSDHFCKVARINREIVEEFKRKATESPPDDHEKEKES